jgi:hypothetical protein
VRIVDLMTRKVVEPVGLSALDREAELGAVPAGVGRHWLLVVMQTTRGSYTKYLNWRTGAVREDPVRIDREKVVLDLDHPALDRPLCAPLRRKTRIAQTFSGTGEATEWAYSTYGDRHLLTGSRLQRCGARRARVLRRADEFSAVLAPGRVTWREGSDLVVEPFRRGARRTRIALPAGFGFVVQTRRRIFFAEYEGNRAVHVARAPR